MRRRRRRQTRDFINIRGEERDAEHARYSVNFDNDIISVNVTQYRETVTNWLEKLERDHHRRLNRLIVGLDVKYSNDQPVATLQLCVGCRCLIFQILRAANNGDIPERLRVFLAEEMLRIKGVCYVSIVQLELDEG